MNVLALARAAGALCRRAASRCRAQTVLLAVVGLLAATPCNAYDVLLRWTVPPEPGVAGYRIYRGSASRSYSLPLDVGRLDGSTLAGVVYYVDQSHQFGSADYVTVTAYTSGGESDYSNEKVFNLTSAIAPRVNAGPDQTVSVGSVVTLGSTPLDGIGYFWQQTTGPTATLLTPTASTIRFTPLTPGTYSFVLTASDAQGVAARDTVSIVVTAAPTVAPTLIVVPSPTRTATNSSTPTLNPTATKTPTVPSGLSNDACANAVVVDAAPYSGTMVTNNATSGATDPTVGCGNGSRAKGVWYRFTAPSTGTLTVNTFGSNYDTILATYNGACGAFTAVPGACNDDSSGAQSRVSFTASAGMTYYFLASAYTNSGGTLVFQVTFQSAGPTAIPSPMSTPWSPTSTPTQLPSSTATFTSGPPAHTFTPAPPTANFTATRTFAAAPSATATASGSLPNDACDNAVGIGGTPYAASLVTSLATTDAADPLPGCGSRSRARSVWYRFTAPSNGALSANTLGSNYDTILSAYTGTCGAFAPVIGACNDDTGGPQSRISFTATAGTTYYFLVSSYGSIGGTLAFQLSFQGSGPTAPPTPTFTPPAAVATRTQTPRGESAPIPFTPTYTPTSTPSSGSQWNDACSNAQQISAVPFTDTVTTTTATTEAADPPPACGNSSRAKSVWYRFTAPSSGTVTATTIGSNYDTILAVYTGSCGRFTPLPRGCNDDSGGPQSRVVFQASAGVTYSFIVTAYMSNGGRLQFGLSY